ncbi:MAG TPA: discoidin domain-containing protein, partial [Pseudonocardiaceae bacterium]
PLGLNGFQVYGTSDAQRPAARGWTAWGMAHEQVPELRVGSDGTVPVESGWALTMDDFVTGDGVTLSGHSVDVSDWLPATVPGTVLASLVEQGHLPDPVAGFNNLHIPEALSRHSWWYRREFQLPSGLAASPSRRIWLEFDGVNHRAEVWLNGTHVGDVTYPFSRAAFDITGTLRTGESNVIAVRVSPMPYPGSPGDKGASGEAWVDAGSNMMMRNAPTYLSISGWDWMPAVRDRASGIWNHVRLRSTGAAVIRDPHVATKLPNLPDRSIAEVTIRVPVQNVAASAQQVTVRAAFDKVAVSKTIEVGGGASVDVSFDPKEFPSLRLRDPVLWWPNGYGRPDLHDLTVTASVGAAESDLLASRFGIREFGYAYNVPVVFTDPQHAPQTVDFPVQQARYVRVLGRKRATSWGMSLWELSVINIAYPGTNLALGKTATASSTDNSGGPPSNVVDGRLDTRWSSAYQDNQWIQVDLGAVTTFDRVNLVWETAYASEFDIEVSNDGQTWTTVKSVVNKVQPLQILVNGTRVFCRGGNWGFDELLRRMPHERMSNVVRMHRDMNFTMIRNWVGSSNRDEFFAACDENGILVWNDFWDAWSMDAPDHTAYVNTARDTVRRYRIHPSIAVWCGANEGAPPREIDNGVRQAVAEEDPDVLYQNNSAGGITGGGGPYWYVNPKEYFTRTDFGFHTEIGMPAVPVADSMRNLVGDQPSWPISDVWFHHDWSTRGNQQPQSYQAAIDARLGASAGLDEFTRKAQLVNYENSRAMFEAWNTKLWNDASGLMLWMSHPAWHSTVWQTYDYDLDVNGMYHGARKGCEPLHAQASPVDWSTVVLNHTAAPVKGARLTAMLYGLDGTALAAPQAATLDLAPSASVPSFTVAWPDTLPPMHLLRLELRDARGGLLSDNTYWRYRQDQDMRQLNTLAQARVTIQVAERDGGALTAVVRNEGSVVAAMVRLSLRDRKSGDRVLPAYFAANYVWLLPGEQREIPVEWPSAGEHGARPLVVVEGYNVPRSER